jgi:hypothetical protein
MSRPASQPLQIQPDPADAALAEQQARFNALVLDVTRWRAALAEWNARLDAYRQAVDPVHAELYAAWRAWAQALDAASLDPGFTRTERAQLEELSRAAGGTLQDVEDDTRPPADEPSPGHVEEDWERQAARAAAHRAQRAAGRQAARASKRRKQAVQEVSQSLRDVYRRLASALHPDREPDAQQRDRKTALMQRANRAYAEGNLLELLELQLQAEQVDAAHLAAANPRRLQHYTTVLQEQLADLQSETRRLEAQFRSAAGLAPGVGLQARKADRIISSQAHGLRGELQLLRRQVAALQDVEATREWLRAQRKA